METQPADHPLKERCEIDDNGCWLWQGHVREDGYGAATFDGTKWRSHRLSWALANGGPTSLPSDSIVHHKCAVRRCINPDHLQLTTHHDNAAEMFGRRAYEARIAELEAELKKAKRTIARRDKQLTKARERSSAGRAASS